MMRELTTNRGWCSDIELATWLPQNDEDGRDWPLFFQANMDWCFFFWRNRRAKEALLQCIRLKNRIQFTKVIQIIQTKEKLGNQEREGKEKQGKH